MYGWSVRDVWTLEELTVMVEDQETLERTLEDLEAGKVTIDLAIQRLRAAVPVGLQRCPFSSGDDASTSTVFRSPHLFPIRTGLNS